MNDRQLSRARTGRKRTVLDVHADTPMRRGLWPPPRYSEAHMSESRRANQASSWSLVRILCAVAVVVVVQILICLDGGIVFDFAARPIPGLGGYQIARPGISAIALEAAPRPKVHKAAAYASPADGRVRPAVLIRITDDNPSDAGQTADRTEENALANAHPIVPLPEIIIPRDGALAPAAAVPPTGGNASGKAAEKLHGPPTEKIMQTPMDRLGSNERHAVLLGLFLLSASDPRLRFGY